MDKHKCQVCLKDFPDGKALEDHLRSHEMDSDALKSSSNQEQKEQLHASEQKQEQVHDSYSSSFSDDGEKELQEALKMISAVDSEHSTAAGSTVLGDDKSTEEISKDDLFYLLFIRAKNSGTERTSSLTTVSNLSPEENGAISLMMLSRDKGQEIEILKTEKEDSNVVEKGKAKGKYKCETCNMTFRSYHALGGHNAKHKRMEEAATAAAEGGRRSAAGKRFICPHCNKVFSSGQALGGHKRSHYSYGVLKPVLKSGEKVEGSNKVNRQLSASHDQISENESSTAAASGKRV